MGSDCIRHADKFLIIAYLFIFHHHSPVNVNDLS